MSPSSYRSAAHDLDQMKAAVSGTAIILAQAFFVGLAKEAELNAGQVIGDR